MDIVLPTTASNYERISEKIVKDDAPYKGMVVL